MKHDISPSLHNSASGPWLRSPGNQPVIDLYSLSDTLPALSNIVTILSGNTYQSFMVKYQDTTFQQAINMNRPYLKKMACHKHNRRDLITPKAPEEMTEIQDKFNSLKTHIKCTSAFKSLARRATRLSQHTTSPEVQLTWIV